MTVPLVPEHHVTTLALLLPQGPHPDGAPHHVIGQRLRHQARLYAQQLWTEAYLQGATDVLASTPPEIRIIAQEHTLPLLSDFYPADLPPADVGPDDGSGLPCVPVPCPPQYPADLFRGASIVEDDGSLTPVEQGPPDRATEGWIMTNTLPNTWPVDVRRIVLSVIETSPEASRAYVHEPAMRHGVEVTIGVLGRAADILMRSGGHTAAETEALILEIAHACSQSGGQEYEHALAIANSQLHPGFLES